MAKRKASSPIELLNGDDDPNKSSAAASRRSESNMMGSTPKRSLGGGLMGSNLTVPSPLTYKSGSGSAKGKDFTKLDVKVSEKMAKVNEAFLTSLAVTLSEQPDAILFPVVESYVRHVHTILRPHLPNYITALDKDKGFTSFARFLDRFKSVIGKVGSSCDVNSKVSTLGSSAEMEVTTNKATQQKSDRNLMTARKSSVPSTSVVEEKPNVFANFKFANSTGPPVSGTSNAPFKAMFDGFKHDGTNNSSTSVSSKPMDSQTTNFSTSPTTGFKFAAPTQSPTSSTLNVPKPNGIIPGFFSTPSTEKSISTSTGGGVSASGFTFSVLPPSQPANNTAEGTNKTEEESEEPPKNEFKQVKEDNSLYEVRCKVFAKVGGAYKDKGVGQLFVKKPDGGKYQVVVRAENNLGTILLNILLQKGIPLSRKGKDVMSCDPTGDNGKPVMIIIRVKNEDVASELLSNLEGFLSESS